MPRFHFCLRMALLFPLLTSFATAKEPLAVQTVIWNPQRLIEIKQAMHDPDFAHEAAIRSLYRKAKSALKRGPYTVVAKTELPPSGDKHDYLSYGPYWWPNPDTDDGRPYIRRDGESNPQSKSDDRAAMSNMSSDVILLSLAAHFSGEERYARHACTLLQTWFVDPRTKMNPHLEFGQAIPGVSEGRGIGIIDTCSLVPLIDAIELLRANGQLNEPLAQGLNDWFQQYLDWLQTSKHGRDEDAMRNNHGTWYDVQCARFALFIGDRALAKRIVEAAPERRFRQQFTADGRQPHELARTKSLSYSVFNLSAAISLAKIGEAIGIDIWDDKGETAGRLQASISFLMPYLRGEADWPHKQIGGFKNNQHANLIMQTADSRYHRDRNRSPKLTSGAANGYQVLVGP